jgi:2-polyprenyl-3-methyl-5-hydroxy-6-metoxy-1,4-benzoquinol methylase
MEDLIATKDEENHYDLVGFSEVLEHVDNQREFLRNCMRLVKPKTGHLFMSSIAKTLESYFLTILSNFIISL